MHHRCDGHSRSPEANSYWLSNSPSQLDYGGAECNLTSTASYRGEAAHLPMAFDACRGMDWHVRKKAPVAAGHAPALAELTGQVMEAHLPADPCCCRT